SHRARRPLSQRRARRNRRRLCLARDLPQRTAARAMGRPLVAAARLARPIMTAARTAFIVNRHAGAGLAAERLAKLHETMARLANGGPIEALDGGEQIDAAVGRALAADCGIVVAGGGDGPLGSLAGHLVRRG